MGTINMPAEEPWRIFRIMAEFVEGFEELSTVGPAVSIFGSARTDPNDKYFELARATAYEIAKAGFAVITVLIISITLGANALDETIR